MPLPRRRSFGFLLVFILTGCTHPSAQEPLLLGYLPTGGDSGQRALQLAVREVNGSEALVAGRRLMVLSPTLAQDGANVQAVATRLVAVNRVPALIGGADAAEAEMIGRAAQPAHACVVAPCAAPLSQLSDNVFPARLAPADQGTLLARHAAEELKASCVAVLVAPGGPAAEVAAAFVRQFTRDDNSRRVGRRSLDEKATWAQLADEVQANSPQAVLIAGGPADLQRLRNGMQKAGAKIPLLFGNTTQEPLEALTESGQPVWGAAMFVPDGEGKYGEFAVNYQKEFGESPDAAARLTYDAVQVLIAALRRSRLHGRDKLREELGKAFVLRLDAGKPDETRSYRLPGR